MNAGHDLERLKEQIKAWGKELGFAAVGVAGIDLTHAEAHLADWLAQGRHGAMNYMEAQGMKRARPTELVAGTQSVIVARLDYLSANAADAPVARYARGRDYHKVMRRRLRQLGERIEAAVGRHEWRAFSDSAPVLEVELARLAGLGWRGKHTLLLNRQAGSWFFLGEIYSSLPLPADTPMTDHCGVCTACIDACPTEAIIAPGQLDARRCISYLTIELKRVMPLELRGAVGAHAFGCDDCQTVCPWNRFAPVTQEADFAPRSGLSSSDLCALFALSEAEFAAQRRGSALNRIGYAQWLGNLAICLGNAPTSTDILTALRTRSNHPDARVREHVAWALAQHERSDKQSCAGEQGAPRRA